MGRSQRGNKMVGLSIWTLELLHFYFEGEVDEYVMQFFQRVLKL